MIGSELYLDELAFKLRTILKNVGLRTYHKLSWNQHEHIFLQIKVGKLLVAVTQARLLFMVNITQFSLETDLKAVRCLFLLLSFLQTAKRVALDVM